MAEELEAVMTRAFVSPTIARPGVKRRHEGDAG